MPLLLISILLVCALVLPVVGALLIRFAGARLSEMQAVASTAALVGVAIASVLVLSRSDVTRLEIGNLNLLQPVGQSADNLPRAPFRPADSTTLEDEMPELAMTALVTPTVRPRSSPTARATATITTTTRPTTRATTRPTTRATSTATPAPTNTATPAPTATPEPEPEPEQVVYVVEPGDTLRSIAAQFDVSTEQLLEANGLTPDEGDDLRPGQELIIPPTTEEEAPAEQPAEPEPEPEPLIYVVEPGDTLRGIAAQFDVSTEQLLEANGLTPDEGDDLRPGQELIIP